MDDGRLETIEAPEGAEVLQIPEEAAYPRKAGPGEATEVALTELRRAAAAVQGGLEAAAFFTVAATGLSLWSIFARSSDGGLLLFFLLACGATLLTGLMSIRPALLVRRMTRQYPRDERVAAVRSPALAMAAIGLIAGADFATPFLLYGAFRGTAEPLDVDIYNGIDAPVVVSLVVWEANNVTISSRPYPIGPHNSTTTGVIATAEGLYGAKVTVDGNRSTLGWFYVSRSRFHHFISVSDDRIDMGQAVA